MFFLSFFLYSIKENKIKIKKILKKMAKILGFILSQRKRKTKRQVKRDRRRIIILASFLPLHRIVPVHLSHFFRSASGWKGSENDGSKKSKKEKIIINLRVFIALKPFLRYFFGVIFS